MKIRVLGFKATPRPDGKVIEEVQFTSADALMENGQISHSTWERISALKPKDGMDQENEGLKLAAMRSRWAQIEPAYLAWKAGQDVPETGTALGAWPGVTPEEATALRSVGIRSVEEVANAPESILARPPLPNMRYLQAQAKEWLAGRGEAALMHDVASLKEQNDALRQMLIEMQAAQADDPETAEKPKRGRPPKLQTEEAA
jgi:hypothetical protein